MLQIPIQRHPIPRQRPASVVSAPRGTPLLPLSHTPAAACAGSDCSRFPRARPNIPRCKIRRVRPPCGRKESNPTSHGLAVVVRTCEGNPSRTISAWDGTQPCAHVVTSRWLRLSGQGCLIGHKRPWQSRRRVKRREWRYERGCKNHGWSDGEMENGVLHEAGLVRWYFLTSKDWRADEEMPERARRAETPSLKMLRGGLRIPSPIVIAERHAKATLRYLKSIPIPIPISISISMPSNPCCRVQQN